MARGDRRGDSRPLEVGDGGGGDEVAVVRRDPVLVSVIGERDVVAVTVCVSEAAIAERSDDWR